MQVLSVACGLCRLAGCGLKYGGLKYGVQNGIVFGDCRVDRRMPIGYAGGIGCGLWKDQAAGAVDNTAFPAGDAVAQAARGVFSTGTLRPKSRYQKWRIWQSCPQQFGVFRPGGTGDDAKR